MIVIINRCKRLFFNHSSKKYIQLLSIYMYSSVKKNKNFKNIDLLLLIF